MSTRCTIDYDDSFHLYQECFEQDNVYLRLDSGDWSASLETATIDWRDGVSTRPQLHIRMNVTMWRQIVEGWVTSRWGQHPELDHTKIDIDPETTSRWIAEYNKNKGSGDAE
jgi:hypothetical protein